MQQVYFDWFERGVRSALAGGHIVVIVDTLRFSTTVTCALARGFEIFPCDDQTIADKMARRLGAENSGQSGTSQFSLSPQSFILNEAFPNKKVVLYSANGAACCRMVGKNDLVVLGSLVNAGAVGRLVGILARKHEKDVTVVGAGEPPAQEENGQIKYQQRGYKVRADEDLYGAGAVIASLGEITRTLNAKRAQDAFIHCADHLERALLKTTSGKYLTFSKNLACDVEQAAKLDLYDIVPVVQDGKIEPVSV